MRQNQFLTNLRINPMSLQAAEVQKKIIEGFLNRWKCRVRNTAQAAKAIQAGIHELQPHLRSLQTFGIENIPFDQQIRTKNQITVGALIERCYTRFWNIGHNFGPTATSKLLHILHPELFIMWDGEILKHYHKRYRRVSGSGTGYLAFLRIMRETADQIYGAFHNAQLNPPAQVNQTPANYLSTQMAYNPPKTMAKLLDEYNWVTITHRITVPPHWHP